MRFFFFNSNDREGIPNDDDVTLRAAHCTGKLENFAWGSMAVLGNDVFACVKKKEWSEATTLAKLEV